MGAPARAVRLARLDEAPLVREIMRAAFAEYDTTLRVPSSALVETVEDVAAHMRLGGAVLATRPGNESGGPVGSGRFECRDGHFYIGRLAVLPTHRGLGIAIAMIDFIEALARAEGVSEARLSVRMALPRNIGLYQRLGYTATATYSHPRGAEFVVDMAKSLLAG
jgi:ribosomal protein S18 acetylase RimI-like enzyme